MILIALSASFIGFMIYFIVKGLSPIKSSISRILFGDNNLENKISSFFDIKPKKQTKSVKAKSTKGTKSTKSVKGTKSAKSAKSVKGFNPPRRRTLKDILKDTIAVTKVTPATLIEQIQYEDELLGYIQTTVDNMKEDYYYVQDMTGYNNKIAVLYQLCDGQTLKIKVRCKELPQKGQIIHVTEITTDKKWGKTPEGEWYRKDETEQLLTKYVKIKA